MRCSVSYSLVLLLTASACGSSEQSQDSPDVQVQETPDASLAQAESANEAVQSDMDGKNIVEMQESTDTANNADSETPGSSHGSGPGDTGASNSPDKDTAGAQPTMASDVTGSHDAGSGEVTESVRDAGISTESEQSDEERGNAEQDELVEPEADPTPGVITSDYVAVQDVTDEESWATACDGLMIENHGVPEVYPPTFLASSGDAARLDSEWSRFLSTYNLPESLDRETNPTISTVRNISFDETPFVLVDPAAEEPSAMAGEIETFTEQWLDLFGARDVTLVPEQEPHRAFATSRQADDHYLYRLLQDFCGVELVNSGDGQLFFAWFLSNHEARWIVSTLMPKVPFFANGILTPEELTSLLHGVSVPFGCSEAVEREITSEWDFHYLEPQLNIAPSQDDPAVLEYRTVIRGQGSMGHSTASVLIDVIDGTVLNAVAVQACY